MSKEKLSPCPFCGGQAHTKQIEALDEKGKKRTYDAVICTKYECVTVKRPVGQLEKAIEYWENRT